MYSFLFSTFLSPCCPSPHTPPPITFPGFLNQSVAPGSCLRVHMFEAEIFPQRVSFWKFSFVAWQSLRALACRTKSMCTWILDPCFIVTKGTMILRIPLESQATVAVPHHLLSGSSTQNWQWEIKLGYAPWLQVTESSECQSPRKGDIILNLQMLKLKHLVYFGGLRTNHPKSPHPWLWLLCSVCPTIYGQLPLCYSSLTKSLPPHRSQLPGWPLNSF